MVDIFSTILEIAGSDQYDSMDGKSFLELLEIEYEHRKFQYSEMQNGTQNSKSISNGNYKLIRKPNMDLFFNLKNDPYENNNLGVLNLNSTEKSALNELISEIENIKFIQLKDIKENPSTIYKEILDFLNIDSSFKIDEFKIVNKNKIYKNKFVRDFLKKNSIFLGKLRSKITKEPLGIIKLIENLNLKEQKRLDMPKNLHKKLTDQLHQTSTEINNIINKS